MSISAIGDLRPSSSLSYLPSNNQRTFWAMMALQSERPIANEGLIYRIAGRLHVGALERALEALVRRHDVLRTGFSNDGGSFQARVIEDVPFELERVWCSPEELGGHIQRTAETRFTPEHPPFFRATLFEVGPEDHALSLVTHHVALDGYGFLQLLPAELGELYDRFSRDLPEPPPPTTSFADLVADERALGDTQEWGEHLDYWQRTLKGATFTLDLPTDSPRPKTRRFGSDRVVLSLPAQERDRLAAAAEGASGRLLDVLIAGTASFLSRYANQREFIVGTPHRNRRREDTKKVFGCLMETLPLRVEIHPEASLRETLEQVRATRRDAFAHLSATAGLVLSELTPADPSRNQGYQVVVNYLPFSEDSFGLGPGLDVHIERLTTGWTGTDLNFDFVERGDHLDCVLEFDAELFERPTAERILRGVVASLRGIEAYLDAPVHRLPVLAEVDRAALLDVSVGGGSAPQGTIVERLRASAEAHPDATALLGSRRCLRYEDLWSESAALAVALGPLSPGATVAIGLRDPIDFVIAVVATLRAGGAYVPLDPALPAQRLTHMLEVATPEALIADEGFHQAWGGRRVDLRTLPRNGGAGPDDSPAPADLAYAIFTSGSTGKPKGVAVRHGNLAHQLDARRSFYGDAPGTILSAYSFAFDSAVAGLFWALTTGGRLVLMDEDGRKDPEAIRAALTEHAVRVLDIPPVLYAELLTRGTEGLGSLKQVILGGEALPPALAERHHRLVPEASLYNEYGPTEATVFAAAFQVQAEPYATVPIGRPIDRTECWVVDEFDQLAPQGAFGELVLGGAGIANGYLNDPERTATRFGELPDLTESTVYRTGDRVRWNSDFQLEFYGRGDRQVQIGGYRVEPGEIESALDRLGTVAQSAVVAREVDGSGVVLDAYVVTEKGKRPIPAHLKRELREALPAAFIPRSITLVDAIPKAPSGKADPSLLPAPSFTATPPATDEHWRSDPYTQTESRIARAMADVLGQDVGVHDDFFAAGGTSIQAIRVLSRLQNEFGGHIPLQSFVAAPTVVGLAELLHREGAVEEEPLVVPFREVAEGPTMWLLHPVGGHVLFASNILAHWHPRIGMYGLQARGLDGRSPPFSSLEEVVDTYLPLIRSKQPEGPYFLGGPSQGGLLAIELARALQRGGAEIGFVALFDTWAPGYPRRLRLPGRIYDHLAKLQAMPLGERVRYVRTRIERRLHRLREDWMEYRIDVEGDGGQMIDTLLEVQAANERVVEGYEPRFLESTLLVMRASQIPKSPGYRFDDVTCGWGPYAREVVTIDIDGTHQQMMDPNRGVEQVTEALLRHLRPFT